MKKTESRQPSADRLQRSLLAVLIGVLVALSSSTAPRLRAEPAKASAPEEAGEPLRVAINPAAVSVENFRGWGVSLCWWAHVVGNFPHEASAAYADAIFDQERGLGLDIVRFNIGGGENPMHNFMQFRARMPGYQPRAGVWDWEADSGQQRMLELARDRGVTIFEAFSNSPPHWMTISGSVTGNHDGRSNLADADMESFVDYFVSAAAGVEARYGIKFHTFTPINEPISPWWKFGNKQEGCRFNRRQQNQLLQLTARVLRRKRLAGSVAGPEENAVKDTMRSFNAYESETREMLGQINTHTYFPEGRAALGELATTAGKELWVSEYGDGDASGLKMARAIVDDLRELRASAWVYWQALDSGGGWGFWRNPLKDFVTTESVRLQKYDVMGNFSRYVRPGSRLLAVNQPGVLLAHDIERGLLIIVVVNDLNGERKMEFDFRAVRKIGRKMIGVRTGDGAGLRPLEEQVIEDGLANVSLPARTVTTYLVEVQGL